jgi:signal peptidase I
LSETAGRPRRAWVAFLLNLVFLPAGYAYLGAWRLAAAVLIAAVIFAAVGLEGSIASPPGIYAFGQSGILPIGIALGVVSALHAAWLARRSPPKSGRRLIHAATYMSTWAALLALAFAIRAFWPHSVYSFASSSMAPTLQEGDIVAVRGARALCGHTRPHPGEVVVYKREGSPVAYMQRVVAGPGQTVALKGGQLWVDGTPAVQQPVGKGPPVWEGGPAATVVEEKLPNGVRYRTLDYGPTGPLDTIAAVTVPADRWYFLGDSRDNSADSRMYGPLAARNICGVAVRILDSKDKRRVGQKP